MIHIVTAANRSLYARQLDEMHRLRWRYYIEERGWRELRALQTDEGRERDSYDDDRAVYLLALDHKGGVSAAMRLRTTADRSLLGDRFSHILDDPAAFTPGPDVWEITRTIRTPENRGLGPVRFAINAAMLEFLLSRGVRKLVGTADTFLLASSRALWREKFRPIGLPHPYDEGELIALEYDVDAVALQRVRESGGLNAAQMFELPAPCPGRDHIPEIEERFERSLRELTPQRLREIAVLLNAPTTLQVGAAGARTH
jgi:acyl-homoserine lactone synthase